MADLIRENDEEPMNEELHSAGSNSAARNSVWLWFFAALAIVAVFATALQGKALGWPAFILLMGITVVAILAALTVFFNRQSVLVESTSGANNESSLWSSFNAQTTPSLIVQRGQPVFANTAYQGLARELGVDTLDDAPVSVERLLSKKEKSASAAIFRLHHTTSANDIGEEVIRTLDANGEYRSFKVRVSSIDKGQLWQLEDASITEADDISMLTEAPIGLFCVDTSGTVLKTNAVLRGWLGIDNEVVPRNMKEFIENPGSLLDSPQTPGRVVRSDTRLVTKKGVVSPVVLMASWQKMDSGDIYASVAVYGHTGLGARTQEMLPPNKNESNDGQPAESSLAPSGLGMAKAPFGVVRLDSTDLGNAVIISVNSAFVKMIGAKIPDGAPFSSLFADTEVARKFLSSGINLQDGPVDVRLSGEEQRPVDVYFSTPDKQGCIAYIVDVSSRKILEEQLGQSQKMQAIGQLAGGVAHDFNNLLTAIRLNTDELLGRHPIGDPSYPELQKINQTVSRATGLVRKLLAFSRKQTLRTVVLDVTETLSDLTHLLQDILVEKVKLEVIHGRGLLPIQADKIQLENVLMNLCVNARDAMLEKGGGTIVLKSAKVSDAELNEQGIALRENGTYVRFDVTDTGTGMDKATQDKIFEPFFTTKAQGKGTGLGLATVYGIVQQSGGHLRVDSELGVGTTFSVYIPTATGEASITPKKKPQITAARNKPSDLAGEGTILFVEDEANVRIIAAKTLRKRGYDVVEAENGEEAYEILRTGKHEFNLMISDVVMPGMDGPTLLKKGRDLLGNAHIVFISGYAEEEFSELLAEEPDVTFLPKPFTLIQLAQKVKSVLDDEG